MSSRSRRCRCSFSAADIHSWCHRRRLIIGIGEKLWDFYWGPLIWRRHRGSLVRTYRLVFLLFSPQGLFGERIIERC
jgi:hypothetical protein